jgi:hypothetical protein
MLRFVALLLCLYSLSASAQNLTGIWRGHFKSGNYSRLLDSLGVDDRYKFETQIRQNDKTFEGVTYSYRSTFFYGKASCVGSISSKTHKVLLGETQLLEVKSAGGGACLMTCFLQYSKVGNEEFLEGTYTSIGASDSMQCGGGTVFLRKVETSDFYKEPFLADNQKTKPLMKTAPRVQQPLVKTNPPAEKKATKTPPPANKKIVNTPTPPVKKASQKTQLTVAKSPVKEKDKTNTPDIPKKAEILKQLKTDTPEKDEPSNEVTIAIPQVLATRQNELVKTITSSSKQIAIKIYDNGTIDNDTVSVYVDKKLVISKQRLTDQAITVNINLDEKTTSHELVMVAENLGEIPPNTSLMVVNAGDQQYEVRITSTEQKNAVVRFKYAP